MGTLVTCCSGVSASPPQRRASGHLPSIRRLRAIAIAVLAAHAAGGIEIDDLVSAGWLGYVEARARARHASYPYQRARWAMLDEIRRWTGATARRRPLFVAFGSDHDGASGEDVTHAALYHESYAVACAAIDRHAEPAHARVLKAMLLDGESIELTASRLGLSKRTVANYKAQALHALRQALAA